MLPSISPWFCRRRFRAPTLTGAFQHEGGTVGYRRTDTPSPLHPSRGMQSSLRWRACRPNITTLPNRRSLGLKFEVAQAFNAYHVMLQHDLGRCAYLGNGRRTTLDSPMRHDGAAFISVCWLLTSYPSLMYHLMWLNSRRRCGGHRCLCPPGAR